MRTYLRVKTRKQKRTNENRQEKKWETKLRREEIKQVEKRTK